MTLPTGVFVYEFLYRGQPTGSLTPPAYHVVLGFSTTDAFGNPIVQYSAPMTPAAATALGMTLPAVVASINTQVGAQVATLQAAQTTKTGP